MRESTIMCQFAAFILIGSALAFNSACFLEQSVKDNSVSDSAIEPVRRVPTDWKRFDVGPFSVVGPADLKVRTFKGDAGNGGYELENAEISFRVDIDLYETHVSSYQREVGTLLIEEIPVKYTKVDLNKPVADAARNADGSRAKPVEKNLMIMVRLPDQLATLCVRYHVESTGQLAMAMLQSVQRKEGS